MPKLIDLLKDDSSTSTKSGRVSKKLSGSKYQVSVGGSSIVARSGVGSLDVGASVTLARTSEGWSIVGHDRYKGRAVTEIQIDG